MTQEVYIVDGRRTPFLKALGKPNDNSAADLAVYSGRALLATSTFLPEELDEVIIGCVAPSADEANIARIISLRLGCGKTVPAWTVARNCASGLQALDCAYKDILQERSNLVLAGGTEAMSKAPLLFPEKMVAWLADFRTAKTFGTKIKTIAKFRPGYLVPVIALLRGLTDPVVNMNMGQTAEKLAFQFDISRKQMDKFALQSHIKASKAIKDGIFNSEIIPLFDNKGNAYAFDNGVRENSSLEKLAKLKPVFDKQFGMVTAGNSSQVTDGACMLTLASKKAVKKHKLKPLAKIIDFAWEGVDPTVMGLGPVHAISTLLQRNKLKLNDVDFFEINEAFAGQVLACVKAMQDQKYCKDVLGLKEPIGELDLEKLNIHGGAIAVGHPVGASGARLALHLAKLLQQKNANYGIATLCIGGGQGGAILIKNAKGEV